MRSLFGARPLRCARFATELGELLFRKMFKSMAERCFQLWKKISKKRRVAREYITSRFLLAGKEKNIPVATHAQCVEKSPRGVRYKKKGKSSK
ncbi:hypothetical protein ANTQUA_LOCUS10360 [Anthophora quadrimaculata]